MEVSCKWRYCGEGNNNIVFTDDDSSHILRVPKTFKKRNSLKSSNRNDFVLKEAKFLEKSVYPLLKDVSVYYRLQSIPITSEIWESLQQNSRDSVAKTEFAILMPNYCLAPLFFGCRASRISRSPVVCVEFRPKSCYMPDISNTGTRDCCYFCMTRLQAEEMENKSQTKYCPFDLYSGSSRRIKRAINHLIAHPQRYFALSIDNKLVYSNKNSTNSRENSASFNDIVKDAVGDRNTFIDVVCNALLAPVVAHDCGSYPSRSHCRILDDPLLEDDGSPTKSYGRSILSFMHSIHSMRNVPLTEIIEINTEMKANKQTKQFKDRSKKQKLKNFKLSRIFNCCSLMISFQKLEPNPKSKKSQDEDYQNYFKVEDGLGNEYIVCMALIDLYKENSPEKVVKFCKREQDVINFYRQNYF